MAQIEAGHLFYVEVYTEELIDGGGRFKGRVGYGGIRHIRTRVHLGFFF
jgi:hypothetical protein